MRNLDKYKGIIPAFYACYDEKGEISPERVKKFTQHLIDKGVNGLYVGGSSGECIYHSKEERKLVLENVMEVAKGKITIIAHVGCNNTADSAELAAHAEKLGVDAIASIPPIYFHLPDYAIADYWNDISAAAPNTDFIIYNIPQLAGVALNVNLYKKMRENPRVIGVKNSSMPVQDIQMFKDVGGDDSIIFNGPDEQISKEEISPQSTSIKASTDINKNEAKDGKNSNQNNSFNDISDVDLYRFNFGWESLLSWKESKEDEKRIDFIWNGLNPSNSYSSFLRDILISVYTLPSEMEE